MDVKFWLDLLKVVGVSGLVFLIWYLYHSSQTKAWDKNQTAQQEQFRALLAEQHSREEKNFTLLNGFLETLQYHASCLARMETKIDENMFCPFMRKEKKEAS